jgi:hypothetical protein
MRHANIRTTMAVYVKDERDLAEAANRLPVMTAKAGWRRRSV